ncbi:hypothetical protein KAM344_15820 [Aeromonas caviae]|nr:hypothetical protein KAM497c_15940 [Aeromonas caviae]GJB01823.1 hypothetical protein KAM360_07660 [Aeromonas caviae]GKQ66417.1 hypothetical protein KAM344_15820 [Aeromonas caviae]GKR70890.1 hypothetical protein KAM479_28110 [Aeromonas caviae]
MFLAPVREQVARDPYSRLAIIEKCGHVCNVEQPEHFNRLSLAFISSQTVE